jgi:hypothetical protein
VLVEREQLRRQDVLHLRDRHVERGDPHQLGALQDLLDRLVAGDGVDEVDQHLAVVELDQPALGGTSEVMPHASSAATALSMSGGSTIRSTSLTVSGPPRAHEATLPLRQ